MKRLQTALVVFVTILYCLPATAQCTGGCPTGAITTMPTGTATLAAGTTYCISTSTDLSSNTYTVNGTLVIQEGIVTFGDITVNKTGVIIVKTGAQMLVKGALTGQATTPASTIDNIVICNSGYLNITGSISQGEINLAITDHGVMKVTGAFTANATDAYIKLGSGSLIELCAPFNINKNGFITETSSDASYLVVHGPMQQGVVNGWLSTLGAASQIKFTAAAGVAFISHPAVYTCNACGNYNLAPPGTSATCGSAASGLLLVLLPLENPGTLVPRNPTAQNTPFLYPNPAHDCLNIRIPGGVYTNMRVYSQAGQLMHYASIGAGNNSVQYNLPANLPAGTYFIQFTGNRTAVTLKWEKG